MELNAFQATLENDQPDPNWTDYLKALWYDGKGDWDQAHRIAQDIPDANGSWIHAYLHRKEGDLGNAAYWYRRAGKPMPDIDLEVEWKRLLQIFLAGLS